MKVDDQDRCLSVMFGHVDSHLSLISVGELLVGEVGRLRDSTEDKDLTEDPDFAG